MIGQALRAWTPGLVHRKSPRRSRFSFTRICVYFSTSISRRSYDDTIANLNIGSHTRVIFQGFTGEKATENAKQSIEYGTKIVGGVTPRKNGEHLGLPVLPTLRQAKEQLKPDATGVYVPAHQAAGAIEEALEAEIPLIVAVAEHIPLHDMLRIHSMLKSQSKSRLVGANSPGIISPIGRCRIGFHPLPTIQAGSIGVVAKSGTLSYECCLSLSQAGIGQSLVIGMGGDVVSGTDLMEALKFFEHDDATKGIVMIGEIGGTAEEEAANWVKEYRSRTDSPKPIMALVGGFVADRLHRPIMGHAGAFISPTEQNAKTKARALEDAGVAITHHPSAFGREMSKLLKAPSLSRRAANMRIDQRRLTHSFSRLAQPLMVPTSRGQQTRNLYIPLDKASESLLRDYGVRTSPRTGPPTRSYLLGISIDRSKRMPYIAVAQIKNSNEDPWQNSLRVLYNIGDFENQDSLDQLLSTAQQSGFRSGNLAAFSQIVRSMVKLFEQKEAFLVDVTIFEESDGSLTVGKALFGFDDAAYRTAKRQKHIHESPGFDPGFPGELKIEKDGIIYYRLPGDGNIGTFSNGAGLAMNTNDAIESHGGKCANFLDTGGKATIETVKNSFEIILTDKRVKTVFVNIFGGLTLCDLIAEGIMLAYQDLGIKLPVVVRLRGTNEDIGQKMIADSGLPLFAYNDFDEAARKAIKLAETF